MSLHGNKKGETVMRIFKYSIPVFFLCISVAASQDVGASVPSAYRSNLPRIMVILDEKKLYD